MNSNEISSIYDKSKNDGICEGNNSVSSIGNKYIKELVISEGFLIVFLRFLWGKIGLNLKSYDDLLQEKIERKEKFKNSNNKLVIYWRN